MSEPKPVYTAGETVARINELQNARVELAHYRAMVSIVREGLLMHPLPDWDVWAANMAADGYEFANGMWLHRQTMTAVPLEDAIELYERGETPEPTRPAHHLDRIFLHVMGEDMVWRDERTDDMDIEYMRVIGA